MSVARAAEINARLRAAGIVVHEWAGWQSRGNGQTSAYEGCIVHHTATGFGFAPAILVNGRSDLPGPLCNYAGNADGSVTVIAAHPANHAGASGGRSMGPLPVTSTFNRRVMGLEIVYPGTQPMTPAQYRTATIWARIVVDVLGYGDRNRARAHAETSITGKWDPGYASGRTIDMNAFRNAMASGPTVEDEMPWSQSDFNTPLFTDMVDGKPVEKRFRDVMAELRDAAKAITNPLRSNVVENGQRSTYAAPPRDFWANADMYGYDGVRILRELRDRVAALESREETGGVDLDALADKVAARVVAQQAEANANELRDRLES